MHLWSLRVREVSAGGTDALAHEFAGDDIVEDAGHGGAVVDAEWPGTRDGATGMRADDARTELGGDLR